MTFKNENKNNNKDQNPGTVNTNNNNNRPTTTTTITKFTVHKYHILNNYTIVTLNPEYSNLISPLKDLEYNSLRMSIKEKGLHLPIIINQDNVLLDGHHRFQICKELGIEPRFEVKKFEDPLEERQFVIDINDKRRHLNDFQKAELAYELEKIESERAKLRSLNNLKHVKDKLSKGPIDHFETTTYKGKTRDIVSRKVGISQGSYERAKTIIKYGSEETKEKLRHGKSTIFKEVEKIRKDQKRQELTAQMKTSESESNCKKTLDNCRLMLGDFCDKGKEIEDNSIDLISTDPPYGEQYLYLYEDLAKLAVRVLKPGGSLVFLLGHIIMDKVMMIFAKYSIDNPDINERGLKFWCPFYVKHNGSHAMIHARNVFAEGKPILWYVKGKKLNELMMIAGPISDFIQSQAPDKTLHDWTQSQAEAEYCIKHLTLENHCTVLDPFMGTGITGLSALNLGRKFVGIEINPETFEIARSNIRD